MDSGEILIKVDHVGKTFKEQVGTGSFKSSFVNLGRKLTGRREKNVHSGKFTALKDVSFEVKKGEFVGLIGRNGCGKSTLLKILAGVYTPSKGAVSVNGKLTPFIELGVGFNTELSGRDNVFLNGSLLGFTRKEMEEMYEDIVNFAELEDFMDMKLKNYSSGMQVRLAFSVAIRVKSDILLIDEVLAVGDENFQKKCFEVFENFKRDKKTIVFVSHSMDSIRDYCDKVVLIDEGSVSAVGGPNHVVEKYLELTRAREEKRLENENSGEVLSVDDTVKMKLGNGSAEITKYQIMDHQGKQTYKLKSNSQFSVRFLVEYKKDIKDPVYGVMIRKNPEENLFGINSFFNKKKKYHHRKLETRLR